MAPKRLKMIEALITPFCVRSNLVSCPRVIYAYIYVPTTTHHLEGYSFLIRRPEPSHSFQGQRQVTRLQDHKQLHWACHCSSILFVIFSLGFQLFDHEVGKNFLFWNCGHFRFQHSRLCGLEYISKQQCCFILGPELV